MANRPTQPVGWGRWERVVCLEVAVARSAGAPKRSARSPVSRWRNAFVVSGGGHKPYEEAWAEGDKKFLRVLHDHTAGDLMDATDRPDRGLNCGALTGRPRHTGQHGCRAEAPQTTSLPSSPGLYEEAAERFDGIAGALDRQGNALDDNPHDAEKRLRRALRGDKFFRPAEFCGGDMQSIKPGESGVTGFRIRQPRQ